MKWYFDTKNMFSFVFCVKKTKTPNMFVFLCLYCLRTSIWSNIESCLYVFASKPNQTRAARTWSTWTSRLSWSRRTASHSQSSWWPPPGRRSLHGPVTSARHVNTNHSLRQSDEKPRMSAELANVSSLFPPLCCICPTVHRQHPLQWADDERVWRQLQSHSATDDQVSLIFTVDIHATLRMLVSL